MPLGARRLAATLLEIPARSGHCACRRNGARKYRDHAVAALFACPAQRLACRWALAGSQLRCSKSLLVPAIALAGAMALAGFAACAAKNPRLAPLSFCLRVWRSGLVPLRRRSEPVSPEFEQAAVVGPERLRALRLRQRSVRTNRALLPPPASVRIIARPRPDFRRGTASHRPRHARDFTRFRRCAREVQEVEAPRPRAPRDRRGKPRAQKTPHIGGVSDPHGAVAQRGDLVPRRGLEPPRFYPLVPETSASTNSATWAGVACGAGPGRQRAA
jgi:hypothetical protein